MAAGGLAARLATRDTRGMQVPRRVALTALLLAPLATACATASNATRGAATDCPVCEVAPPLPQLQVPALIDHRADTPELDRSSTVSLEAFSADGALVLLRVDDSARGLAFIALCLDGSKQPRHFPADGSLERDVRQRGLRALGPKPVTHWSARHPTTGHEVAFSETATAFAVLTEVDGSEARFPLALLPRHATEGAGGPQPSSATKHVLAWAPGGGHLVVIYGQLTRDAPALRADRWYIIPASSSAAEASTAP